MKTKEIKELETQELKERIDTEVEKLNQMKLNHTISPLENPSQIKSARRDIARMKTVLRERELNK
jgi:large subunit ribosomal protein L29